METKEIYLSNREEDIKSIMERSQEILNRTKKRKEQETNDNEEDYRDEILKQQKQQIKAEQEALEERARGYEHWIEIAKQKDAERQQELLDMLSGIGKQR